MARVWLSEKNRERITAQYSYHMTFLSEIRPKFVRNYSEIVQNPKFSQMHQKYISN